MRCIIKPFKSLLLRGITALYPDGADLLTSISATLKDKTDWVIMLNVISFASKSDEILVQIALFNLSIKRTHNQSPLRTGRRQKPPNSPKIGHRTEIARTYQEKAEKLIKK